MGVALGRQPQLVGGGLVRSEGGWSEIKALRRIGEQQKGDERILGSGAFVSSMLSEAELVQKYRLANLDRERSALELLIKHCRKSDVSIEALCGGSRLRQVSAVRRELVYRMTEDLGLSFAEVARLLGFPLRQWRRLWPEKIQISPISQHRPPNAPKRSLTNILYHLGCIFAYQLQIYIQKKWLTMLALITTPASQRVNFLSDQVM